MLKKELGKSFATRIRKANNDLSMWQGFYEEFKEHWAPKGGTAIRVRDKRCTIATRLDNGLGGHGRGHHGRTVNGGFTRFL